MNKNTHTKFLNPHTVLFRAGLKAGQTVADLGSGSGFYALASADIVGSQGAVHVADVKESSLDHVMADSRVKQHRTIKTYLCNLEDAKLKCKLPEGVCDMVVLANIMHEVSNHKNLLQHAYSLLKTGGRLVVVDWNDNPGPIGPAADKRISEQQAKKVIESCSYRFVKNLETDAYHFGLVFER